MAWRGCRPLRYTTTVIFECSLDRRASRMYRSSRSPMLTIVARSSGEIHAALMLLSDLFCLRLQCYSLQNYLSVLGFSMVVCCIYCSCVIHGLVVFLVWKKVLNTERYFAKQTIASFLNQNCVKQYLFLIGLWNMFYQNRQSTSHVVVHHQF